MAAAAITIGVELEGVFVELACYIMSAFAIGFGTSKVKSIIEARGYKVKEGETANESKNQKNISQTYKLEYNYNNKLVDIGNVYFFSEEAKGKLSDSFLPLGLILSGNENKPYSFAGFIPEKSQKPPYEIFPIPEIKQPITEVYPIPEIKKPIIEVYPPINNDDIPKGEIFPNNSDNKPKIDIIDKSNDIELAFFIKIRAENGDVVEVPKRLLDKDGNINLSLFKINVKNCSGKKEKKGWSIEVDKDKHGWGKVKKLKDEKGNRVASLDENGKIVGE